MISGKFVQAQATQEAAAGNQTFVGAIKLGHGASRSHQVPKMPLVDLGVGIDHHRAELEATERLAA